MKKIIKIFSLMMIFSIFALSSYVNAEGIYVNNYKLTDTKPIVIKNSRAYMDAYDASRVLGGIYAYDAKSKTATIYTDDKTYKFVDGSNLVIINGDKMAFNFRHYVSGNKMMIPASLLGDLGHKKLHWDYNKRNLLVNSNLKTIKDNPVYTMKDIDPILKKSIGSLYDVYNFKYALTSKVRFERFLVDGKYFIFKANEKGNITKNLNGYFFMNVYTNDVYYYPIDAKVAKDLKKFANGKEVVDYKANARNTTQELIATTNMLNDIKSSDTALAGFSYARKYKIKAEHLKAIPKADYYYYQASKKVNGVSKPQFELAQNAKTLDLYLFLKTDKGTTVVKYPEKTVIKTIK